MPAKKAGKSKKADGDDAHKTKKKKGYVPNSRVYKLVKDKPSVVFPFAVLLSQFVYDLHDVVTRERKRDLQECDFLGSDTVLHSNTLLAFVPPSSLSKIAPLLHPLVRGQPEAKETTAARELLKKLVRRFHGKRLGRKKPFNPLPVADKDIRFVPFSAKDLIRLYRGLAGFRQTGARYKQPSDNSYIKAILTLDTVLMDKRTKTRRRNIEWAGSLRSNGKCVNPLLLRVRLGPRHEVHDWSSHNPRPARDGSAGVAGSKRSRSTRSSMPDLRPPKHPLSKKEEEAVREKFPVERIQDQFTKSDDPGRKEICTTFMSTTQGLEVMKLSNRTYQYHLSWALYKRMKLFSEGGSSAQQREFERLSEHTNVWYLQQQQQQQAAPSAALRSELGGTERVQAVLCARPSSAPVWLGPPLRLLVDRTAAGVVSLRQYHRPVSRHWHASADDTKRQYSYRSLHHLLGPLLDHRGHPQAKNAEFRKSLSGLRMWDAYAKYVTTYTAGKSRSLLLMGKPTFDHTGSGQHPAATKFAARSLRRAATSCTFPSHTPRSCTVAVSPRCSPCTVPSSPA